MTKIILTIAVLFTLNLTTSAGDLSLLFKDNRSTEETRILAATLKLNEQEIIKIKKINDQKFKDLDQTGANYTSDLGLRAIKMKEVEDNYNALIRACLSPDQNNMYSAYLNKQSLNQISSLK